MAICVAIYSKLQEKNDEILRLPFDQSRRQPLRLRCSHLLLRTGVNSNLEVTHLGRCAAH